MSFALLKRPYVFKMSLYKQMFRHVEQPLGILEQEDMSATHLVAILNLET